VGFRSEPSASMSSVRIYGYPVSTWTRTVWMTCIEKGIEHELVPIAYGSSAHAALHPFLRIPAVEVDGTVLTETLAITGLLDEEFPGPSLQPGGGVARARMRMWMSVCADYLFRDVVRGIPRNRMLEEDERTAARQALERADGLVGVGPFLVREDLTLADLYLAPQVSNCREKAPALLDGLVALAGWAERIAARDSFRRTGYDPAAL
jgi:glutathione S-transferase